MCREAANNLDGDPRFVMNGDEATTGDLSLTGATYLPWLGQTVLADPQATFTPSALVGRLINADSSQSRQSLILNNTQTTIFLSGDASGYISGGATYQLVDYKLMLDSAALDRATSVGAPSIDLEFGLRPADYEGIGFDGAGDGYDIGAYELQPPARIVVWPTTVDFGDWDLEDGPTVRSIEIANAGYERLNLNNIYLTGGETGDFSFVFPSPAAVPGLTTITLQVSFDPTAIGDRATTLVIESSDADTPSVSVNLLGFGVDQEIDVDPSSVTVYLDLDSAAT
ncbi:unnamed protein product, partial [marine sediment metagenome]